MFYESCFTVTSDHKPNFCFTDVEHPFTDLGLLPTPRFAFAFNKWKKEKKENLRVRVKKSE